MSADILASIRPIISLTPAEQDDFLGMLEERRAGKHEFVLREGGVCRHIFFVASGSFRVFCTVEGEEKTIQFFMPGSWYTDYGSLLTGSPSEENFQALEPGSLTCFTQERIEQVYAKHPRLERLGRIFAEQALVSIHNKNKFLVNKSPEERYRDLIQDRPELFRHIPQHYIASYLNIQPPSLSRIKRRVQHGR